MALVRHNPSGEVRCLPPHPTLHADCTLAPLASLPLLTAPGQVFALKKMDRQHLVQENMQKQIMNERFVLGDFDHPCDLRPTSCDLRPMSCMRSLAIISCDLRLASAPISPDLPQVHRQADRHLQVALLAVRAALEPAAPLPSPPNTLPHNPARHPHNRATPPCQVHAT